MSFIKLPPLGGLEAFIMVAQRGSLRAAAPELNLSVSALSRRIQTLESHVGVSLFERGGREFRLTLEGQALLDSVCLALDMLGASISSLRPDRRRFLLRIGAPAGLAGFWLAPRLAGFRTRYPHTEVSLDTGALSPSRLGSGLHALLTVAPFDPPPSKDRYEWRTLSPVRVRAVCSPDYLKTTGGGLEPGDLGRHVVLSPRSHPSWLAHWSRAAARAAPPLRIEAYDSTPVLLEAAASGLGVGLVSELLAAAYIAAGRLVDPFGVVASTSSTYCFVTPCGDVQPPVVQNFGSWVADELTRDLRAAA